MAFGNESRRRRSSGSSHGQDDDDGADWLAGYRPDPSGEPDLGLSRSAGRPAAPEPRLPDPAPEPRLPDPAPPPRREGGRRRAPEQDDEPTGRHSRPDPGPLPVWPAAEPPVAPAPTSLSARLRAHQAPAR